MATNAAFHGPNAGYVLELYDQYLADPNSVSPEIRQFFSTWSPPATDGSTGAATASAIDIERIVNARTYVGLLRRHGHLGAHIDPLFPKDPDDVPEELRPETYGLTEADLATLPAVIVDGPAAEGASNALEAIRRLREIYDGTIGYEFTHVQDRVQRDWLRDAAESGRYLTPLDSEEKRKILQRLTQVEAFERFLHQAYLGQKRFSVEGNDLVVPMLDRLAEDAHEAGVKSIVIGMAHRGRLNVLTHVVGKPYDAIIAEFEHLPAPSSANGVTEQRPADYSGDVKYHMGWHRTGDGDSIPVLVAPNPSHLEWVDPVVEGMTRASQDSREEPGRPGQDVNAAMAVLLHGDAAFPGQGVVAETLNLSGLEGFTTGGTIHIITNNQIGYTTNPNQSRSTLYASDLAKGFEIPIVHVNADDPEACLAVTRMALDYRMTFGRDFLIDLVGYRRWGHNEGDEPSFTQPAMYVEVNRHPTVRARWAETLAGDKVLSSEETEQLLNDQMDALQMIRDRLRENANGHKPEDRMDAPERVRIDTEVSPELISQFNDALHTFPEGFTVNRKLSRQLERRRGAVDQEGGIDWAHAETLALASILAEGTPVRMTGQDTERGTFSQRHLVLHDPETAQPHSLLEHLPQAKASFAVYNSPLSEAAVLGFEYGYSVAAPEALVLWEAQFGDFANSAQVIIDQFIASASSKWGQRAGLVLLLPHGYEGQGPEHSSARLERFLQLAARDNLRVVNMTRSAQYFHVLRRQAKLLGSDPRPLVVMTPKSLLRHPFAGSSLIDLASGGFQPVIDDEQATNRRERVTRAIFCSGKVFVDLATSEFYGKTDDVAIIRVEELYPFPADEVREVLESYPNVQEVIWLQEEPQNMGAWFFTEPRLRQIAGPELPVRYIGRPAEASPAEGSNDVHIENQARIVQEAFASARVVEESVADD